MLLPPPLTDLDGAIVACGFGTAYAACVRANVSGRDRVLITGMGPVGLGVALVAQNMGACVLGIEFDPVRVAFARKLGIQCAQGAIGKKDPQDEEEDADNLSYASPWANDGVAPDVCIDCSGSASARLHCLKMARVWGRVVFVGEGGRVSFNVSDLVIHKQLTILGSWVCSISQMEELVERLVKWNLHPEVCSSADSYCHRCED